MLTLANIVDQPPIVLPGDLTPRTVYDFELANTKAIRYTSPIRQRGLSHIPNEVYMEISQTLRRQASDQPGRRIQALD